MNGRGQNKLHRKSLQCVRVRSELFRELEFFGMIYECVAVIYSILTLLSILFINFILHCKLHRNIPLIHVWHMTCEWGSEKAIDSLSHDKIHLGVCKTKHNLSSFFSSYCYPSSFCLLPYLYACLPCDNEIRREERMLHRTFLYVIWRKKLFYEEVFINFFKQLILLHFYCFIIFLRRLLCKKNHEFVK